MLTVFLAGAVGLHEATRSGSLQVLEEKRRLVADVLQPPAAT